MNYHHGLSLSLSLQQIILHLSHFCWKTVGKYPNIHFELGSLGLPILFQRKVNDPIEKTKRCKRNIFFLRFLQDDA